MNRPKLHIIAGTFLLCCFFSGTINAEIITGTSAMKLNTPATAEIRRESVTIAADSLKSAIHKWLKRNMKTAPDLTNPVQKHFFLLLAKDCIKKAKQDSYFEGRDWTLNLDLNDADLSDLISAHNARCDSIAQENWAMAQQALAAKQNAVLFRSAINALFYSMGRIGPSEGGQDIQSLSRTTIQDFLKTCTMKTSTPIIKGKLGEIAQSDVIVTASIGDAPFADLAILARLPNYKPVASLVTDKNGEASLGKIKMPFIAYGTFLHIVPNFGAMINPAYTFEAEAFGVKLTEGLDQTLIFNIIKPAYTLTYRATAANQIQVPGDFAGDARVRKFLEDSCHARPMSGAEPVDLAIDIQIQVSSYSFDDREETDLKADVQATIRQMTIGGKTIEKTTTLYKKTYDSNHAVPAGEFFWEAAIALKSLIREMLGEL